MKKVCSTALGLAAIAALALSTTTTFAGPSSKSGTTLAGYKTIDICEVSPATDTVPAVWRYSGDIAVWNEGALNTTGLKIVDVLEYKTGNKWLVSGTQTITDGGSVVILAGTVQVTATIFHYSFEGPALPGTIRNTANITILNHSSSIGKAFGPSPKATWIGEVKPCVNENPGCTYTQGYWGNKPNVIWPNPYDRTATFFLSGQTWQQVLDTPVNVSQGYYQLAHQYIAAVLNAANSASVPSGVQTTLDLAEDWLNANGPSACTGDGSCGTQKDWAAVLDEYNNGVYLGGPGHCGDE
jgi:hypothetical protein